MEGEWNRRWVDRMRGEEETGRETIEQTLKEPNGVGNTFNGGNDRAGDDTAIVHAFEYISAQFDKLLHFWHLFHAREHAQETASSDKMGDVLEKTRMIDSVIVVDSKPNAYTRTKVGRKNSW